MGLEEILQKLKDLSSQERETLRRELGCTPTKAESQDVSPETAVALGKEQQTSNDERSLPVEDIIQDSKS